MKKKTVYGLILAALFALGVGVFVTCENGLYGKEPIAAVAAAEQPALYVRNRASLKDALERDDIKSFTVDVNLNTNHEITVTSDKVITIPAGVVVALKSLATQANVTVVGPAANVPQAVLAAYLGSETDNGTDNGSAGIILIKNSFNVAAKTEFNLKGNAKLAFVPAVTEDDAVVDGVLTAEIEGSIFWVAGAAETLGGSAEHKFGGEGSVQTSGGTGPVAVAEAVIYEQEDDTLQQIPIVSGSNDGDGDDEDDDDDDDDDGDGDGDDDDDDGDGDGDDGWDYDEDGDWPSGTVTSIALNNSTLKMTQVGEMAQLTVTFDPDSMKDTGIIWSSSKPAVATVTGNGLVKAVGMGQTTIIAKTVVSGKTATCTVDVSAGLVAGLYENDDTEPKDLTGTNGNNLLEKSFAWIKANSTATYGYTIVLDEDISVATGFTIGSGAGTTSSTGNAAKNTNLTITLKGLGQVRTITKTGNNAPLFKVYGGSTSDVPELVLDENITLRGNDSNKYSLIEVGKNTSNTGKLTMKAGSRITGNINTYTQGGGVYVYAGSTFNMEGGSIDNNKTTDTSTYGNGGAVFGPGAFNMSGGVIAANSAAYASGAVVSASTFKKTGGTIYGNGTVSGDDPGADANTGTYTILCGAISYNKWRKKTADADVSLDSANAGNTNGWGE